MEKNKGNISCFEQGPAVLSAARMIPAAAAAVSPLHPCPQGSFPCIGAFGIFSLHSKEYSSRKKLYRSTRIFEEVGAELRLFKV